MPQTIGPVILHIAQNARDMTLHSTYSLRPKLNETI
jgi:DNA primase